MLPSGGKGRTEAPGYWRSDGASSRLTQESDMSKAKDTRKDLKKKPAKSLMEKRAAKKEKKASRLFRG